MKSQAKFKMSLLKNWNNTLKCFINDSEQLAQCWPNNKDFWNLNLDKKYFLEMNER